MTRRIAFLAAVLLAARISSAQSIAGVVSNAAGKPIRGAMVAAVPFDADPDEVSNVTRTGADGRYRFAKVDPGKYAITVTAPGLVAGYVPPAAVSAGHDLAADVALTDRGGYTLRGVVRDPAGKPRQLQVFVARISADNGDVFVVEADAEGRYAVRLPEGGYRAVVVPPGGYADAQDVPLHADTVRDLRFERMFEAVPPEAVAWIRKAAIPLTTARPGALDDMAPIAKIVGNARLVALGEATHGTREFFQLKHRMVQFLVEKMGFTVFGIEATMPGTMVVNDYVVDGKGDATKALKAMQFWTWNTDEVRALIEWMRAWNATHERKVAFYGFDMQDPAGAVRYVETYLEPRDAGYAKTLRTTFTWLNDPQVYASKSEAVKSETVAAIDELAKHVDAQAPHDREWELARHMVDVLRQGERMAHSPLAGYTVRDPAMAENVRWILDHEPAGTRMVLWAHNGHVSAESDPGYGGSMGSHLRRMFGDQLVIFGFSFDRGMFRALETGGARRGLTPDNHVDAAPKDFFDAGLAASGIPLFALDLRTAQGVAGEWVDSPLRSRSIGAVFNPDKPGMGFHILHPRRSFDAILFVAKSTAAEGHDRIAKVDPDAPPPAPPAAAAVNLDFEAGTLGEVPAGWKHTGGRDAGFRARLVEQGCATGRCLEVKRTEKKDDGYGVVMQLIDATPYRGKRIRLRGNVRSELEGDESTAQLWLRVDRPEKQLGFFDNMMSRPPHALPQWTELTIDGTVAADAKAVAFGTLFIGEGTAWYDDFRLEVIP